VPSQSSTIFIELIGFISAGQEIFSLWDLTLFPAMRVPLRNPEQRRNAEKSRPWWTRGDLEIDRKFVRTYDQSFDYRLRLDPALLTTATRRAASLPGATNGGRPRIMNCKDLEQIQRDNIIAALECTRRQIYRRKGAAKILASARQPSQHE
jgi:hypothetical protein